MVHNHVHLLIIRKVCDRIHSKAAPLPTGAGAGGADIPRQRASANAPPALSAGC